MEFKSGQQLKSKWNKSKCQLEAIKYKSKPEYKKKSQSAYTKIRKNNWLEECKNILKNKINNYD